MPATRNPGWPAATLVAVAFGITMLGTTLPTPLYPLYAAKFGFGDFVTTVIFAVYAVGVLAGLLLFGHWSDQLGRRPLLLAGLLLSASSALVFLVPTGLGWLLIGRLLSGLSAGIFTGTATATIVDLAPDRTRGSLTAAAVNLGGLGLGPLLAGVLAQYAPLPLRLSFAVDLGLVLLALGCLAAVPEPVRRAARPRLAPRRPHVPGPARDAFVRAGIVGFAGFGLLGLFSAVAAAFVGRVLHHGNHALVGVVVAALFESSLIGQTLSSRMGLHRSLIGGCAALAVGVLIIGAALPLPSLALLIVGAVVAGLGQGMSFRAGLGSVTAAGPPESRAELTSALFVVLYLGTSLPVVGVGGLATGVGLVGAGVVFSLVVAALAGIALLLLLRARTDAPDRSG